jgi:thiamine biosynthesis protein ThiS
MQIYCNGQAREISPDTSLQGLLDELRLEPDSVVAEINKQIIERDQYEQIILADQDQVELIRFVGGG